ncbi:MAG: nicotinamide riboside transporter PnuC [Bacteroidota bacterium]
MLLTSVFDSIVNGFEQTSYMEWFIFASAMVYVILAAIENVWCWLFGILSSFLSIYLCFSGKLFLESILQVFYVIIGIYGWYQWLYGSKERTEITIVSFPLLRFVYLIIIGCLLWIPLGYIAQRYSTQAMPYLDAFITSFSIIATWMTAKKIIQNWLFWLIIDASAILLYAYRGFHLIALLYIIYTFLALVGYFQWRKKINM